MIEEKGIESISQKFE